MNVNVYVSNAVCSSMYKWALEIGIIALLISTLIQLSSFRILLSIRVCYESNFDLEYDANWFDDAYRFHLIIDINNFQVNRISRQFIPCIETL